MLGTLPNPHHHHHHHHPHGPPPAHIHGGHVTPPGPQHLFIEPPPPHLAGGAGYPKGLAAAYQYMQSAAYSKKQLPGGYTQQQQQQQIMAREMHGDKSTTTTIKQGSAVMTTTNSGPEYVSIRYFAPVSQVNPRIMKGEMMNAMHHQPIKRDSSRPKLTTPMTPGIHFAPNLDPSFSFNYSANPSKIFAPSPQPHQQVPLQPSFDYNAIPPYRMLNFEQQMKQQQPQQSGGSQQSMSCTEMASSQQQQQQPQGKQSQQEQSYQRPVSSLWNMAGGAGNTGSLSHKFMSEYSDELKNYGNYFNGGPNGSNQGFLNRFVTNGEKQLKGTNIKYALFCSAILLVIALIVGAVFFGIFISDSKSNNSYIRLFK